MSDALQSGARSAENGALCHSGAAVYRMVPFSICPICPMDVAKGGINMGNPMIVSRTTYHLKHIFIPVGLGAAAGGGGRGDSPDDTARLRHRSHCCVNQLDIPDARPHMRDMEARLLCHATLRRGEEQVLFVR